ncbi:MAG: putative Fe-S cluster assembly protein SufT [Steroidobacteraceae bacterium]
MLGNENEPVTIQRDVEAVIVPAGVAVTLRAGKTGFITQALGGSFTVYVEGNLFRIAGKNADAIGREPELAIEVPADATDEDIKKLVWDQMRLCFDPEIPVNIVELGLIYDCQIEVDADGERIAKIAMTLTAPGCGMGEVLVADVREKVEIIPTIKRAEVELTFDPPWNQTMMSEVARLQTGMM